MFMPPLGETGQLRLGIRFSTHQFVHIIWSYVTNLVNMIFWKQTNFEGNWHIRSTGHRHEM